MATITIEQAKLVSGRAESDGRLQLAESLGWDELDEENDKHKGLHLDCLYDCLMFCTGKGLPWAHCCELLTLTETMLTHCKEKTLVEAVHSYKEECVKHSKLGSKTLTIFTDYLFSSFFQHYNMYALIFGNPQEEMISKIELKVETTPAPLPLKGAKDVAIWTYEKRVQAIEEAEKKRETERLENLQNSQQIESTRMEEAQKRVADMATPLERETLIQIIHEVAASHVMAVSNSITSTVEKTRDHVDFMLQKTLVPRPQALDATPQSLTDPPQSQAASKASKPSKRNKSSRAPTSVKK